MHDACSYTTNAAVAAAAAAAAVVATCKPLSIIETYSEPYSARRDLSRAHFKPFYQPSQTISTNWEVFAIGLIKHTHTHTYVYII